MVYIHQVNTVSPQYNLISTSEEIKESVNNVLHVIEPKYEGIPLGILRRMGKAVRMGVGSAMPLLNGRAVPFNGVLIGTANGGMEDCIKFLNQVIEFEEGTLTPTNFVQSTTNAVASQIGLFSQNKGYNVTHVNRGFSFENALLDVFMLLNEYPTHTYLVGGVEEISNYNYNIDRLAGTYKLETVESATLYDSKSAGTIAGEGAAMFVMSASAVGAIASVDALKLLTLTDVEEFQVQLELFIKDNLSGIDSLDVVVSPENGDERLLPFLEVFERVLGKTAIVRYKHLTGDFATASALALSITCDLISSQAVPKHMLKAATHKVDAVKKVLIFNSFKGVQHSLMLVSKAV
jgi:hypothetical protein